MRTLYALVFVCMSLQASAFDLDALNEEAAVVYYEYTVAAPQIAIPSEETSIDPTANWVHLDYDWDSDTTASIPEAGTIYGDDFYLGEPVVDQLFPY
ncbi:MAG: hypothetical protein WD871_09535 [Xanthobacteraceae bacterium]